VGSNKTEMGNQTSADAYTYLSSDINVDVSSSCSGAAMIDSENITINIGEIDCANPNVGNSQITQEVNCSNDTAVQAFSQAVINSSAAANSGFLSALSSGASATDAVTTMQNISSNVQSRCDTSSAIINKNENFTIGKVTGKQCNIFNSGIDQKFSCINQVQESLTTSANITQSATATSGLDLGSIIAICIAVIVVFLIIKLLSNRGARGAAAAATGPSMTQSLRMKRADLEARRAIAEGKLKALQAQATTASAAPSAAARSTVRRS
jgi:hypothetical protein